MNQSHFFVAIPAGGIGTIVGALITYYLKSDTKRVAIIPWIASLVASYTCHSLGSSSLVQLSRLQESIQIMSISMLCLCVCGGGVVIIN